MATAEEKITEMGLEIPPSPKRMGVYVPAVTSGNFMYTAGQLPMADGKLTAVGKVPTDVPVEDAQLAARQALLNVLSVARAELASLDKTVRIIRLNVFVNSAPGFTGQAKVANAASELLLAIFGEAGRHTRCAVGVAGLPLNSPVEIDMIAEVS
ncbi:MAG: RidA family protein [Planctomycetota bacterium]|jgi:enamine deaminase RidA (YjgF/YER057c/UK114 family)|nr:RidA family protein [Planctomycetota bacterium]